MRMRSSSTHAHHVRSLSHKCAVDCPIPNIRPNHTLVLINYCLGFGLPLRNLGFGISSGSLRNLGFGISSGSLRNLGFGTSSGNLRETFGKASGPVRYSVFPELIKYAPEGPPSWISICITIQTKELI